MVSWWYTQRIFLLGAGCVLLIHFSLLYLFLSEQLSTQKDDDSRGPPYYQDERSPLEANPNTDWGPMAEPRLLRHLEYHQGEAPQEVEVVGGYRHRQRLRETEEAEGVGRYRHRQRLRETEANAGYNTAPVAAPEADRDKLQQHPDVGVNSVKPQQQQDTGLHPHKHTKLQDTSRDQRAAPMVAPGAGDQDDHCFQGATPADDIEEPLEWQEVVPGQTAVFSAYLALRPAWTSNISGEGWAGAWPSMVVGGESGRLVVIGVAGAQVVEEQQFHCQVWYRADGMHSHVVQATAMRLDPNSTHMESDVFFYCPVSPSLDPMAVSIINRRQCAQVPPNLLQIRNIDEAQARTRPVTNFTVCVPPLQARYNDVRALVETAELNMLLGAGRLVFYDQDTTDTIKDFYESYKREDSATVIPWKILPPFYNGVNSVSSQRSPQYAVLAALNDCLHRFKFSSRFIVFANIDEFIIPEVVNNWEQLMGTLYSPRTSVYRFSRVPFTAQNLQAQLYSASSPETQYRLLSQLNTWRLASFPPGGSTAYMVTPTQVEVAGVHDVIKHTAGNTLNVDVTDATLHEYRHVPPPGGGRGVVDKRALVYNAALKQRVAERHSLVRGRR